ncbi:MAG: hypothetical protein JWR80_4834 [Bradyrhizobium sp.]|nr:hypothetical protein [Bradyrhizobium sp.]MDB5600927.1 hypothetical protein [Xanthobacteraceae bacterium]
MPRPRARACSSERLRVSPTFALTFTLDGRPYIAQETEPYTQYWLNDTYRLLHSMFAARSGSTPAEAIDGYLRLTGASDTAGRRRRLVNAVEDMRETGVLISTKDDTSRYTARMVRDYLEHRPFPQELSQSVIDSAPVTRSSRVLDLAGGPGDLALALAQQSDHVSMMELSRGFLRAASSRCRQQGLKLNALHDSCNRLVHRDDSYDVITVAQALHWLDDVLVCRGVCRLLRPDGSFFVIHSAIELDDQHPLAFVFGNNSILGAKKKQPFVSEVAPLIERLTLLFRALDAPDVQRIDPAQQRPTGADDGARIVPASASLFREHRQFGLGYARAFLTAKHIEAAGLSAAAFWAELEKRCAAVTPEQTLGVQNWAVLHFRRGGQSAAGGAIESLPVREILPPTARREDVSPTTHEARRQGSDHTSDRRRNGTLAA